VLLSVIASFIATDVEVKYELLFNFEYKVFLKDSPSWEVVSRPAGQNISVPFMKPED
jgi:hypothetical protein